MTNHGLPDDLPSDDVTEAQLHALLRDARDHYNVPPAMPVFDAMWTRIEHDAFGPADEDRVAGVVPIHAARGRWARAFRNHGAWAGLAAGLLIGVVMGRQTTPTPVPAVVTAAADTAVDMAEPVDLETARYLGQTAALLVSLPVEPRGTVIDVNFASRAQQLLATTRVLLDAASDAETRALLEDLELVLAQIVGIRAGNRSQELELINQALEQRELLPRLHSAVNGNPVSHAD